MMNAEIKWIVQKGYSINSQLISEGLSFEAFDLLEKSAEKRIVRKIKTKIVGKLAKGLRSDCQEQGVDIQKIQYGCYCIALGTGFEMDYAERPSRILYIGSGSVYSRIKSHLSGKLFDFASILRSIPLRFYVCDLSKEKEGGSLQRELEQALLQRFHDDIDTAFPLLNDRNAKSEAGNLKWGKGWDFPIQRERGKRTTNWLLKADDADKWKGAI